MTCDKYRELISARIDGELDPESERTVDQHLASCPGCRAYHDGVWALRRSLRVRPVDTAEPAATASGASGRLNARPTTGVSILRWALFVIGGTLVALNAQAIFAVESGSAAHLSRHDGVFGTALGIGMMAVASKPYRAIGLVPLTSTMTALMLVVAVVDLADGTATVLAEAVHAVELAGLLCLWVVSGGPTRARRRIDTLGRRLRPTAEAAIVPLTRASAN